MRTCLAFFLAALPTAVALAYHEPPKTTLDGETWTYEDSGAGVAIRDVETHRKDVRIPDSLDGKKVIGLSAHAFMFNTNGIQSLYLPSSVTNVGEAAGRFHTLRQFRVDSGNPAYMAVDGMLLTRDGTELLRVPAAKESVVVPEGVTRIRTRAFYECPNLVSIELPTSLRTLDGYAFSRCPKLERLEIRGQVKALGAYVIDDCNGLRELVLPDGMETIYSDAVRGGGMRLSVRIPRSVRKLEYDAFRCRGIGRMLFEGDAPEGRRDIPNDKESVNLEQNWILYAYEDTKGWPTFGEWKGYPLYRVQRKADRHFVPQTQTDPTTGLSWEYVVEGKGVTIVAVEPYPIGNLTIPAVLGGLPVMKIGRAAFADFRRGDRSIGGKGALRSVHIPDSVVDIDRCAFDDCSGLKSLRLPPSLRRLGSGVFTWCSGLKSLTVPSLVHEIPNATFWGCTDLEALMFKGDMPEIGEEVFKYVPRVTIYADKRADGWPEDGLVWGFELRRIDKGGDFRLEEDHERQIPYMLAEKKDISAGAEVLKKICKVPDFKFGLDCPIEKIPDVFAWPAFGGKCLEYPVVVDEPFLDMGVHRVLFGQREQVFGHRWIRNEFRHPVDRATRVALYEIVSSAANAFVSHRSRIRSMSAHGSAMPSRTG